MVGRWVMAPAAKAKRIGVMKQRKQNAVRNKVASKNRPTKTRASRSQYGQNTNEANFASVDLFLSRRESAATKNTGRATMGTARRRMESTSRIGFFQKSEPQMTNKTIVITAASP